jgi:6-phosphogluconolactonase
LSRAAVELFLGSANARIAADGCFFAALSGGATPRRLYQVLAASPYSDRVLWERVHLFQVDERCVPPDHPESNFRMIRETLLGGARVPGENFHRIAGEDEDVAEAARRYGLELARTVPAREGDLPRFDLIFLGMGTDGHTASLFPGSAVLDEGTVWVRPAQPPQGGVGRITLTFPVLNAAAQIVFLVSGAGKAETLRKVLEGPDQPRVLPAQGIRPTHGTVSWLVDREAANSLESRRWSDE